LEVTPKLQEGTEEIGKIPAGEAAVENLDAKKLIISRDEDNGNGNVCGKTNMKIRSQMRGLL
jgi:hypothetical protein